jgi:hypothetical protein
MTKTQNQYAEQCRTENPEMVQTINGIAHKLGEDEYEQAVAAWALMRWYQDNPDQQPTNEPVIADEPVVEPIDGEQL